MVFSEIRNIFAKKIQFFMKKIIGIGNALTDVLYQLNDNQLLERFSLPLGSMQLIGDDFSNQLRDSLSSYPCEMVAGGSAANTMGGIAALGGHASFIGCIGKDEIGTFYQSSMESNGVLCHMQTYDRPSGNCTVLVSPDGERTMCTSLGAAVELNADSLESTLFEGQSLLHLEGYLVNNRDLFLKAARLAKEQGLMISIDLASYNVVDANREFLLQFIQDYVDIVFANEEEAKSLTQKAPREALDDIAEMCAIAVVKLGAKGSYIKTMGKVWKIDAVDANCIDTTGAGDLFAAGFLYGWTCGCAWDKCGEIGSLVAAKTVEVIGPKMTKDTWNYIKSQL